MKRVLIATGGTGGHIYPATALAEILKKQQPDCDIRFFGSSNRMEADFIPSLGYRFYGCEMTGMNGGLKEKLASAGSLVRAAGLCRKILKEFQPEICVGFGNYISVPLILTAKQMGIPAMIHEQNSWAGKANVLLGKFCDAAAICYESSAKQFPKRVTRVIGNPEATKASAEEKDPSLIQEYGLDPDIPFVLMMMGSLGSYSVSRIIDEACALFDDSFQVLIAAGKANDYIFENTDRKNVIVRDYVNGVQMLIQCDAAVLRAGATTMCEIAAIGTPSVLVPSPYVPNNHQYHNAMELVSRNAALMIEEKDLSPQKLADEVNRLMKDQKKRQELKKNAVLLGRTDAAYRMIDWMEECVRGR